MPIYELECPRCDWIFEVICSYDKLKAGSWDCDLCKCELYKIMSLPSIHSMPSGYPFDTPPWLLPPIADGKGGLKPQIHHVTSRAQYLTLLKEHDMTEVETGCDKRTMYEDKPKTGIDDKDIDEDMRVFNQMKSNPEARRRIIREAIHREV